MSKPKFTIVYFEGDDDKAFLEKLSEAKLLPPDWELARRDKQKDPPGKDGVVRQLIPFVCLGANVVALINLDDLSVDQLVEWFRKNLIAEIKSPNAVVSDGPTDGRVTSFRVNTGDIVGKVALIGVGLIDDHELKNTYKVDRFAIDDWVFRLDWNSSQFHSERQRPSVLKYLNYSERMDSKFESRRHTFGFCSH